MAEQILFDIVFKGLDSSQKRLAELNKEIIKSKEETNETKKAIAELEKQRKSESGLTDEQKNKLQELNQKLFEQGDQLKTLNKERSQTTASIENNNKATQSAVGSNEQLRAILKATTAEYDAMSKEQRENTDEGKLLQAEILGLTNKLKGNEKAVGDNRRNVGNYEEAITGALGKVNIMGVNLGQMTTQIKAGVTEGKSLVQSMVATATATTASATATKGATVASGGLSGALKILKFALIATGIGAIAVVLGTLVAAFLSTQKGVDAVNKVLEPLKAQFQAIIGIVQDVSQGLGMLFKGDIKGFFKNAGEATAGFGDKMKEAGEKGARLAEIKKELNKASIELADIEAKSNNIIAEGIETMNDRTASEEDRVKAIDDVKKAINAKFAAEEKVKRLEVEQLKIKKSLNDTSDEELLQLAKLEAELENLTGARQREINAIDKKAIAVKANIETEKKEEAKAYQDKLKDQERARLEALAIEGKYHEDRKKVQRQFEDFEVGLIEDKFEREKMQSDIKLARLIEDVNKEFAVLEAQYSKDKTKLAELEREKLQILANAETEKQLFAEAQAKEKLNFELEQEKNIADAKLKRQITDLEFEKNKTLENAQLTADEKLGIEKQFEIDKAQLQLDALTQQAEVVKAELEKTFADANGLGIILLTEEEETLLKEQLNTINAEMAKISETLNGTEDISGLNLLNGLGLDEVGQEKLNFAFDVVKSGINSIGNLMSTITDRNKKLINEQVKEGVKTQEQADKEIEAIEKKAFKRNKALQIGMAIVNATQAVLKTIAETTDFTPPQAIRTANAIAIGAFGAAQVATIAAQKFASGGYVSGAGSGTSDSIPARLSNGEYVIKQSAVSAFGVDFLNAINNFQVPKFAVGGLVTPQPIPTTSTGAGRLQELSNQVQNQELRVINVESDFSNIQNKVTNVERAGTF